MPAKANRATWGKGGAVAETDRSGRLIDRKHSPKPPETQAGKRLARYVLNAHLLVVEATFAEARP
jgi:hypothetical protein